MGHCSPRALVDNIENKMKGMADDNPVYANTAAVDKVFNWMDWKVRPKAEIYIAVEKVVKPCIEKWDM